MKGFEVTNQRHFGDSLFSFHPTSLCSQVLLVTATRNLSPVRPILTSYLRWYKTLLNFGCFGTFFLYIK